MVEGWIDALVPEEIVRLALSVADSEPIILFGSAARGDATEHREIDTLMVSGSGAGGRHHRGHS